MNSSSWVFLPYTLVLVVDEYGPWSDLEGGCRNNLSLIERNWTSHFLSLLIFPHDGVACTIPFGSRNRRNRALAWVGKETLTLLTGTGSPTLIVGIYWGNRGPCLHSR